MPKLNKNEKILNIAIAVIIVLIGISLRLLPHPPNFAPIAAIALFSGVYFSRKTAMVLPLAAMLASDMFLGFYEVKLMAFVYGSFLLCVVLGFWIKRRKKWQTVIGGAFFSSLIFFVLTNFAVWVFTPWYAKTFEGLVQCYLMALPFFKNTLSGGLFYAFVFFGSYELITLWVRKRFINKVALITGGGRGIGEGIALAFADKDADIAILSEIKPELEAVAEKIKTKGRKNLSSTEDY